MAYVPEDDIDDALERVRDTLKSRIFLVAAGIFVAALLPRILMNGPSLWPDEGQAMVIARNALQGEGFHKFGVYDVPLRHSFYAMLGAAFLVFGYQTWAATYMVAVLGALTAVVVYLFGREAYNEYAGIAAGALMLFTPIHWMTSMRVLTDVPVTFFMMLAAYLFYRSEKRDEPITFYLSIIVTGIAATTKLTGVLILPIFMVYALYTRRRDVVNMQRYWRGWMPLIVLGVLFEGYRLLTHGETKIIGRGLEVFFFLSGKSTDQLVVGNFDYGYYVLNLPGILGMPLLVLGAVGLFAVYLYRAKNSRFVLLYLGAIFLIFTLKTYNTNRYFLPFAPMAAVLAGYGIDRIRAWSSTVVGGKAAIGVYAVVLLAATGMMYAASAGAVQSNQQQGYVGYQEAGEWLQQNSEPGDKILTAGRKQIAWYSNRGNITPVFHGNLKENESALEQYIVENNVKYIELDPWEFHVPDWQRQYFVQNQDKYRPVKVVRHQGQPIIIIFQVNQNAF